MHLTNKITHKTWIFATVFFVTNAFAGTPFSQYGMIQNVQNYANNPFYNPNTAQITTPRIVYANGPALSHDDCTKAVQNVIETVCSTHDFCQTTTLADVRPSIMIKLSTLPGNNYASSCSGYIDTIYENYKKRMGYATSAPMTTNFPTFATKTNNANVSASGKSGYNARAAELKQMQATNPLDTSVNQSDFPTTVNDLSYQDRMDLITDSYSDYMNAQAYVPLNVVRTENPTGSGGKPMTECQAVYNCIAQYDAAEKQAEQAYIQAYNYTITIDSNSAQFPEYLAKFTTTQEALIKAYADAEYSPCICTQNSKSAKELLKKMNIKKCDEAFLNKAKENARDFVATKIFKK